eukprot:949645-Lingulodinium_polyedra.AAC.1
MEARRLERKWARGRARGRASAREHCNAVANMVAEMNRDVGVVIVCWGGSVSPGPTLSCRT